MTQAITTTSANLPPAPASRMFADMLAIYRNAVERTPAGLLSISDKRAPAGVDRERLESRLVEIDMANRPGPPQAIARRVARLFLRFPSSRLTDANSEATVAAYAADLSKFPLWAIDQAMMDAITKGGSFAPSSPELRAMCERALSRWSMEAADIRAVLTADVYHEQTDAERAKVKEGFDALVADLGLREDPWLLRAPGKRPYSSVTPAEAVDALEAMKANPEPPPALSPALRAHMGLDREAAE